MKNKSFSALLITISLLATYNSPAADLTQQSVSEEAYKSTMSLMNQIVSPNFMQNGLTPTSREQWATTIENLAAYFNKTKSLLISQANVSLFNNSIKLLQDSTKKLFETVDYLVSTGEYANTQTTASKLNSIAAYIPEIELLVDKLTTTSSTDFKGTKDLKKLFSGVVEAWQQLLIKAHAKLHASIASKETGTRKAKLEKIEADLKKTELPPFFLNQISWVKKRIGEEPGGQGANLPDAAKGLDAMTNQLAQAVDKQTSSYNNNLVMLKSFYVIKKLYAQLPANLKQDATVEKITSYSNLLIERLIG